MEKPFSDEFAEISGLRRTKKEMQRAFSAVENLSRVNFEERRGRLENLQEQIDDLGAYLSGTAGQLRREKNRESELSHVRELLSIVRNYSITLATLREFADPSKRAHEGESESMRQSAIPEILEELKWHQEKLSSVALSSKLSKYRIGKMVRQATLTATLVIATFTTSSAGAPKTPDAGDERRIEGDKSPGGKEAERKSEKSRPARPIQEGLEVRGKGSTNMPLKSKAGADFTPSIGGSPEGQAGQFEHYTPFANVEFYDGQEMSENLWVTEVLKRDPDKGTLIYTERTHTSRGTHGEEAVAKVSTREFSVRAGQRISLPVPIGHTASWPTLTPNVPHNFDWRGQTLYFYDNADNVRIGYKIYKVRTIIGDGQNPSVINEKPLFDRELSAELRAEEAGSENLQVLLKEHLAGFSYIVSNQLQQLISQIPGSLEDKIAALKVGDCDTLSLHCVKLLNDAGHKAYVGLGFLEEDSQLGARDGHGKLIIEEGEELVTMETTGHTKDVLVNLQFTTEDHLTLQEIAEASKQAQSQDEILEKYEQFRTALAKILEKEEYREFESQGGQGGGQRRTIRLETNALIKDKDLGFWRNLDRWAGRNPALAIAIITVIALLFGSGAGIAISKVNKASRRRSEREASRLAVSLFQQLEGNTPPSHSESIAEDEGAEGDIDGNIRDLYKWNKDLEELMPLEEALIMKQTQKRAYFRLMGLAYIFSRTAYAQHKVFAFVTNLLASAKWKKIVAQCEADGINLDEGIKTLRDSITDPKSKEKFEEGIPECVNATLKAAEAGIRTRLDSLGRTTTRSRADILNHFGIQDIAEESTAASLKRPPKQEGTEFYDRVEYTPGADIRRVDWRASARTDKILVRRSIEGRRKDQVGNNWTVVIDVPSSNFVEIEKLTALILETQRGNTQVQLQSIVLMAYGRPLEVLDRKYCDDLTHGKRKGEATRYLLGKIEKLRLENSTVQFIKGAAKLSEESKILTFPVSRLPQDLKPSEKPNLLVLGTPNVKHLRNETNMIRFERVTPLGMDRDDQAAA